MLRKGIALFTGLALCLSSAAFARAADEPKPAVRKPGERKPGEARPERKPGEGPRAAEFLKKFDKNGDGKLDDAEKAEAAKARGAAGGRPGAGIDPAKMQELVKKYDKDGDGTLNETEKQAAKEEFMKLRGGEGRKPGGPGSPDRAEMLKKFDKNGDGTLDEAEKAEALKSRGGAPGTPRKRPESK